MGFFAELRRRNVIRVGAAYVAVSLLAVQVIGTLFALFGFSGTALRAVALLLAIGFVASLVIAWSFELTTGGLKREAEFDHMSAVDRRKAERLDQLIIVMLVLALSYFAFDRFIVDPIRETAPRQQLSEPLREVCLVRLVGLARFELLQ